MKPDWCPQEVWEAAEKAWVDAGFVNDRLNQIPFIARALLAAEQRGRKAGMEEAAKMAEGYADFSMSAHLTKQTKFATDVAARSIASEIRAKANEVKP